jgi:hypothetical protein
MNEKIKKLSLSFEDLIKDYSTPQEVYNSLMSIVKTQKDYFEAKGPVLVIQLTFLIYSYKTTGSFELGEKMLNDNEFLFLIWSSGENHKEICQSCYGNDGYINCEECDGTGEVNCHICDGVGEIDCEECNGSGIDSDNDEEECRDCNGAGKTTCYGCHGNETESCQNCIDGLVTCDECDGSGEIETDSWDYDIEIIMTWDKNLIENAKETYNSLVPIMSVKELYDIKDKYVFMYAMDGNHAEFRKGFRANEVYCFDYADNPRLEFSRNFQTINANGSWRNIAAYEI